MKLKDLTDLLTFESFRPEPDDGAAPWTKRFDKKRTLMLNIGRKRVSWRTMDKNGAVAEANAAEGEFKEIISTMGHEWKDQTDGGWCGVSINQRYVISLEANLSRRKGMEEMLRTNPKAALGAKAERGKRYTLTHNPESNTSVLLACEEDPIIKVEAALREAGLQTGRVCVGVYAMLQELIDQVQEARRVHLEANADAKTGTILMVACCEGSLCAMVQQEEQWLKLRSRTDLYTDDMSPVVELLVPMIEETGPATHVLFMNDTEDPGFVQLMQARMPSVRLSDVTVPNQLWNLMGDL